MVAIALRLADIYTALGDDSSLRRVLESAKDTDPTAEDVRKRLRVLYEQGAPGAELADLVTGDAELATETPEKVRLYRRSAEIHTKERKDPASAADLLGKATQLAFCVFQCSTATKVVPMLGRTEAAGPSGISVAIPSEEHWNRLSLT